MRLIFPGRARRVPVESTLSSLFTWWPLRAMVWALLAVGLVRRNPEFILFSALILATVLVTRLWCRYGTRGVELEATVSRSRLYPQEELILAVRAVNRRFLPVWVRAEIRNPAARAAGGNAAAGSIGGGVGAASTGWPDSLRPEPAGSTAPPRPFRPGLVPSLPQPSGQQVDDPDGEDRELEEAGGEPGAAWPPFLSGESGLLAFQQVRWERSLTAVRRGAYELGPVRLEAGDLLGFYRRREKHPSRLEVLVYPRLVKLAPLSLPMRDLFGLQAARNPVEDPACCAGTRDYHGLRPARHIHWKASARLNRLQEKLHEPTSQVSVLVLLDAASFSGGQAEREDLFEQTLEVVASLVVELDSLRVPVGLAVNARLVGAEPAVLPPGRGPAQVARILETLARLTRQPVPAAAGPAEGPSGGSPGGPSGGSPGGPSGGLSERAGAGGGFAGANLRIGGGTSCLYVCRSPGGPAGLEVRALRYRLRTPLVVLAAETAAWGSAGGEAAGGVAGGGPGPGAGLPVIRLADLHPEKGAVLPRGSTSRGPACA